MSPSGHTELTAPDELAGPAAADLLRRIQSLCGEPAPSITVRLDGVRRIDAEGLGALVRGLKAARDAGGDLLLGPISPEVARALDATGLDRVLPTAPEA